MNDILDAPTRPGVNGGRLKTGNVGNRGGSGRPPGVVREACRKAFADRVRYLKDVVDGKTGPVLYKDGQPVLDEKGKPVRIGADDDTRLKAMDLLGKYGALQKIETETHDATLEDLMREAAAAEQETPHPRPAPIETRDAGICHHDRHPWS